MRSAWVVLAVLAGACSESKSPPARGLRVPLPDGWVANGGAAGALMVGPKGRVVLTLERRSITLPAVELLTSAVEVEGASVLRASSNVESVMVRYARPGDRAFLASHAGLLQARTLENGAVLLCASTPQIAESELDAAEALCAGVRLEAAR